MNRLLFLPILLAIASSQFQPLNATTYYVATNGSDSALGTSWAQAFQTISNAIAHAGNGDTIWVSNGVYYTLPLIINNSISIKSTNGAQVTKIILSIASGTVLEGNNPGVTIEGFTIANGNAYYNGGGVNLPNGGTVKSCIFTNNRAMSDGYGGGAIYIGGPGLIENCIITKNRGMHYGAVRVNHSDAIVNRCIITNNSSYVWGGGVYLNGGKVYNTLIAANYLTGNHPSYGGGGVFLNNGAIINCTIVSNTVLGNTPVGGVYKNGGNITNTIIYYNKRGSVDENINTVSGVSYSCAPELTSGTGNITNEPEFADVSTFNFRLSQVSPCLDKGTNSAASGTDLDGNTRIKDGDGNGTATVDIGAYEEEAKNAGPLRCAFTASPKIGTPLPLNVIFSSQIAGSDTNGVVYCWDFENDGVTNVRSASAWKVTNSYSSAGIYDVKLVVTNSSGNRAELLRKQLIVAAPSIMYVSTNGAHIPPYDTWEKAATNLHYVLPFQTDGLTILVSNGIHAVVNASVNRGITIKSVSGSPQTTIFKSKDGTTRVFEINHPNALMQDVTVRGGLAPLNGGGINLLGGTIKNCIIETNQAPYGGYGGGGIYAGGPCHIINCIIRGNYGMHYSGGIYLNHAEALVENCAISNNSAYVWGAGVYVANGTVRNSIICKNWLTHNHPTYGGGGIYLAGGKLENCTIVDNYVGDNTPGGGVLKSGGSITNCIIYYNKKGAIYNNLSSISGVSFSCAPELTSGIGNITGEPEFADKEAKDYRLWPFSPCIDAGTNILSVTNDFSFTARPIDGDNDSIARHDMGAIESPSLSSNPFRCNFLANTNQGVIPLSVVFTSTVAGPNTAGTVYRWDFDNDGDFEDPPGIISSQIITNTFTEPGLYSIRLVASNSVAGTCTKIKAGYIIAFANILYVSQNGSHTPPFTNWATAATNIASALAYAANGVTILVSNGTYYTSPLLITKSITLKSTNGPLVTKIALSEASGTVLEATDPGFTIEGFTIANGNAYYNGGGVKLTYGGTIKSCIFTNNRAMSDGYGGGAIYIGGPGLIEDCIITKNSGFHFGAIYVNHANAIVNRCIITNNSSYVWGGGVCVNAGNVRNSLICKNYLTGNHSQYGGGGARITGGFLENCTIVENWGGNLVLGGGLRKEGGSVTNCIIYYNRVGTIQSNIYSSTIFDIGYSCSPELTWGEHNITNQPSFKGTNIHDYALTEGSPCINAGKNLSWMTVDSLDLAMKKRKINAVDIGAYEFQPKPGLIIMLK